MLSTDEKKLDKKNVYFNFGAEDSYFLRIGSQHRSFGDVAGRPNLWTGQRWQSFDCVAWKGTFYFACRHGSDRINDTLVENGPPELEAWVAARKLSPLRFVAGDRIGCWFAWMLHGDFLAGPNVPPGMLDAANEGGKVYTSIRCAALGKNGAWLLIWDDGEVRLNLKDEYTALEESLDGLSGDDITWAAVNAFRSDDYFLHEEKMKTASFRVSEAFGKELDDALISAGITTKALTYSSKEAIKRPFSIPEMFHGKDITDAVTGPVKTELGALVNAVTTVVKVAKVGAALAGVVMCNVM